MKALTAVLFGAIGFCSAATYAGNVVRIIGDEDKSVPKYEETKYSATLKDYNYEATVAGAGIAKPIDGNIGEFLIQDVKLTMKNKKFESGAIETDELGKIRILFSSSLSQEGFIALLTEEQLVKLERLLPKETVKAATAPVVAAAEKMIPLDTEKAKISYIIGTQLAASIRKAKVEVDTEAVIWGLKDALMGNKPAMTRAEMNTVYKAWAERRNKKLAAEKAKEASENLAKGNAFLEANKAKEGVVVLPSGLQYKVIKEGTGKTPTKTDRVKTHYRGRFVDGKVFQSSFEGGKPIEFGVTGVIRGWTEALQLMKEGAKWELYVPANLAYGVQGRPPGIPGNSALIFEIELIEIVRPTEPAKPPGTAKPEAK
ncbi:MAG: FKBP-type peptidyl-prolyl cis-trans isomerase [Phycisphaerales bacterium]|nr:MAG: FKBP-type peptidyl-prolyl cis-trans isomerase [Phycisphaerales bacterium]